MKVFFIGLLAVIGLIVLGWGLGWFNKGAEITSARHVEEQWGKAYTAHNSLKATAANVCSARAAAENEADPWIRPQRQTQVIAQEQNYARVAAQYDAAMSDAFQTKLIKPGDLPEQAPTLAQATAAAGC